MASCKNFNLSMIKSDLFRRNGEAATQGIDR